MVIKEVYRANSLQEALQLLKKHGEKAKVIAGGTDLVIQLKKGEIKPQVLIDISGIEEIKGIEKRGEYLDIGAAATFTNIAKNPLLEGALEGIREASQSIGSPQIRNSATIGGNICNASPAADMIPPLLALEGKIMIKSLKGQREIALEDFLLDKGKVDLKPWELVYNIKFKNLRKNQGLGFAKLGLRKALAISRISIAVWLEIDSQEKCNKIRIASGSLGTHGMRERKVEEYFIGKKLEPSVTTKGIQLLKDEIDKRLKGRSSLEFKREAICGVFQEAMKKALERCRV